MKGTRQYESRLNARVVNYLNKLPASCCYKRHAGPFRRGRSDVAGTVQGRSIELEGKVGDNKPTALQKKWLKDQADAGAITGVFYSLEDVKKILAAHKIVIPEDLK